MELAAYASAGNLLERQNLRAHPDLLNQSLHSHPTLKLRTRLNYQNIVHL